MDTNRLAALITFIHINSNLYIIFNWTSTNKTKASRIIENYSCQYRSQCCLTLDMSLLTFRVLYTISFCWYLVSSSKGNIFTVVQCTFQYFLFSYNCIISFLFVKYTLKILNILLILYLLYYYTIMKCGIPICIYHIWLNTSDIVLYLKM